MELAGSDDDVVNRLPSAAAALCLSAAITFVAGR